MLYSMPLYGVNLNEICFIYPISCNQLHYAQQECLLFYMIPLHNKFLVKTFLIIHGTSKIYV